MGGDRLVVERDGAPDQGALECPEGMIKVALMDHVRNPSETISQHCALNGHIVRLYMPVSATRKDTTMLISRSLLKGFGRGLAAPGMFFERFPALTVPKSDAASVENAWKEVGRYLNDATAREGDRIGKKASGSTGTTRKRRSKAA